MHAWLGCTPVDGRDAVYRMYKHHSTKTGLRLTRPLDACTAPDKVTIDPENAAWRPN